MKFAVLLLILISCSHQSIKRSLASGEDFNSDSCTKLALAFFEQSSKDHSYMFKSYVRENSKVSYWINFDRVKKTVLEMMETYTNQVDVKVLGKYDGEPIFRIDIPGQGKGEKKNILISAGVHGNESAGVATVLNFIQKNIYNPHVRNNFNIVIIPYLNPGGLKNNVRRLNNDIDLNRTFTEDLEQGPTRMIQDSLRGETFAVALDLHEAPFRDKFFVIKSKKDDQLITRNVLETINKDYLYTSDDYPGHMPSATDPNKNSYVLYGPGEAQSFNTGTVKGFYFSELGVEYSYTLEAPGKFDLNKKIDIYTDIVEKYLLEILNAS